VRWQDEAWCPTSAPRLELMATLFLTCGVPGSGKTTLARRLEAEQRAVRLTADEWLHELYPSESDDALNADLPLVERLQWVKAHRPLVERIQWALALRTLALGVNVVLDWGLWTREERDRYRAEAQEGGVRVVLCVLDPSRDELVRRLKERNAALPAGTFRIDEALLDYGLKWFERPTSAELALFDDTRTFRLDDA
jgi:predicted kinase